MLPQADRRPVPAVTRAARTATASVLRAFSPSSSNVRNGKFRSCRDGRLPHSIRSCPTASTIGGLQRTLTSRPGFSRPPLASDASAERIDEARSVERSASGDDVRGVALPACPARSVARLRVGEGRPRLQALDSGFRRDRSTDTGCSGVALATGIPGMDPHPYRAVRVGVSSGCRAGPVAASREACFLPCCRTWFRL